MYVCICHGLTERKVREAIRQGSGSAGDVFRHFGISPKCGKCLPYIREMVAELPRELIAAE